MALPFAFELYRQAFTSVKISSNGHLVVGGGDANQFANTGIPNGNQPNGLIAPYWDDLNPASGGAIWQRTTGTAPNRKFTVAWVAVPHYSYGDVTLEVTLEEGTNDIVYSYKDVFHENAAVDFGASATVGVENLAGTVGREFLYREPRLQGYANAKSLRFTNRPSAPADTTAPAPPTGLTAAGGARQVTLDWADNIESDLAGYRVYRNGTLVGTPAGSSFTDTGLADATTYGYEVSAVDARRERERPFGERVRDDGSARHDRPAPADRTRRQCVDPPRRSRLGRQRRERPRRLSRLPKRDVPRDLDREHLRRPHRRRLDDVRLRGHRLRPRGQRERPVGAGERDHSAHADREELPADRLHDRLRHGEQEPRRRLAALRRRRQSRRDQRRVERRAVRLRDGRAHDDRER